MDPISQGTLGAIASQNLANKKQLGIACLFGFLSGMSADLDVLIRSDEDPLLFLEFHRQFTHSLVFIPIGGFICSVFFQLLTPRKWKIPYKTTFLFCLAGYATHALLDACTSYGTQLFWPFSNTRVAWNTISIVDPVFTIPLLGLIITSVIRRNMTYVRIAAIWVLIYISFGLIQRDRAESLGLQIAQSRGHNPSQIEAKPGFGNLLLWKTIYEFEDNYFVDGVRVGLSSKTYPGESIAKLNVERDFPWISKESQQARDIERFRWFSEGFVAVHKSDPSRIVDMRYSMLPNKIDGLWMIELDQEATADQHVGYAHEHGDPQQSISEFWLMLKGK